MSASKAASDHPSVSAEDMNSALFAYLVMQQSNMAMMLLGKTPHPETGQTMRDLDAAKMFIDQLEMLEVKTKGNLSAEEANLLKQNLMTLRLAFVEAADAPELAAKPGPEASTAAKPEAAPSNSQAPAADEDEHRKKFSKKY